MHYHQIHYPYLLLIDLEATCCDQNSFPRSEMEIIEIGAVIVETETLTIVDEFCTFIRPIQHPQLTPFCTQLTTITQADVDGAPSFSDALKRFNQWHHTYAPSLFCSWGNYDKNQLRTDCAKHEQLYPFGDLHLNIKTEFAKVQGLPKKGCGMKQALSLANLPLDGTHHRGIDDARNMVKLMPFILGREQITPSPS